ncbi:hypothetical protein SDC9_135499 [bioreactor metagenome]|uniref:Uncharacterized protein n=1 Tax=bioreactor metagenome TaxID=1076179 RepID=A0A645DGD3_9ZZZZ
MAGVEYRGKDLGGDALKIGAAVIYLLHGVGLPDGEGASAQQEGVSRSVLEHLPLRVFDVLNLLAAAAYGLAVKVRIGAPLSGIALVRGEQILNAADLRGGQPVGHIETVNGFALDVDLAVIVQVDLVPRLTVIFEAQSLDGGEGLAGDIEGGNGACLLQGNVGCGAVGGKGNILRLQILRGERVRLEQHQIGHQLGPRRIGIEAFKGNRVYLVRREGLEAAAAGYRAQVDDGNRALGVGLARAVALPRLALVGGHDVIAVGGETDHVGLVAGFKMSHIRTVIVQKHDGSVLGEVGMLNADGHNLQPRVHIHAGDVPG